MVAIAERARQVDAFVEVNKTVERGLRDHWQDGIDTFVADPDNAPNPYVLERKGEFLYSSR